MSSTATHRATAPADSVGPILLTTLTLLSALLAAAASPTLMPAAGSTLAYVGWSGAAYGVPRGLAYPLMAVGVVMVAMGVAALV